MKKRLDLLPITLIAVLAVVINGCDDSMTQQMDPIVDAVITPSVGTTPFSPPEGMVLIPAGEFLMGSNDAEAQDNEQPVHTVYIDAFYIDETEVTNLQFKNFLIKNPHWQKGSVDSRFADVDYLKLWDGNNYPSGEDHHPAVYVNWYAAMAYSNWVGKRLPTEAEWEYAARGGLVGKKYSHGDTLTPQDANYDDYIRYPTAVRSYPANDYGLYDMTGNVFEWVLDEYDDHFYLTFPQNGVARNPLSSANSIAQLLDNYTDITSSRILRGGSWFNKPEHVRVAFRTYNPPRNTCLNLGFRCAMTIKGSNNEKATD